jgi:RNA polymerase sigma factor (sigma-70 family)
VPDTEPIIELLKDASTRREAFSLLVKQYKHRIYGIVRKMVISHDDADDIVQDVFVKVWNNLDKFKGDSVLFTWLYRIATNEALQFLRRKRNKIWFGNDITKELAEKIESDKYVDGDEIQLKLQKAILRLPDKQRLVFNLRYFEDLSYEEISVITEVSVGSLKASFHHATKKIEEFLQDD